MSVVHICGGSAALDHLPDRPTYKRVKSEVLRMGRFSVFDATRNKHYAGLFDRLERDPTIIVDRSSSQFPWLNVREANADPRGAIMTQPTATRSPAGTCWSCGEPAPLHRSGCPLATPTPDGGLSGMTAQQLRNDIGASIDWPGQMPSMPQALRKLDELLRRLEAAEKRTSDAERVLALYEYVPGPPHEALDPEDPADDECPECGAFRSVGRHLPSCDIARILGRPTGGIE